jgi:Flp pilus assembly protein TadD
MPVFTPIGRVVGIVALALTTVNACPADVTIHIPKHSELTPVQRLNREGVEAIEKHQYEKATSLFYKAYLYDPVDPFTLNNLGYIAELQSDVDRAHMFYKLAAEQGSTATIDRSNARQLQGKPMQAALSGLEDGPMRVNRMNMDAIDLLEQNRGFEAVDLLKKAEALDPKNPFTMNNLGVAYESIGDYENALQSYEAAADMHSTEAIVVAMDRSWRGKPVSAMANDSARRLNTRMKSMTGLMQLPDAKAPQGSSVMYAMRGVSAVNQNDWLQARQAFLEEYSIDPTSAFSLNNRGYVAEMDGDMESAQFFYNQARKADGSNLRVGLASRQYAEGRSLTTVASDSSHQVGGRIDLFTQARRQQSGPVELVPRGEASSNISPTEQDNATPSAVSPATEPQPVAPKNSDSTQGVPH